MTNALKIGLGRLATFLVGATFVLGASSNAWAVLLAYEGFDYTIGAGLADLNGGTGWTTPWNTDQGGVIGDDVVQATSLPYMDSLGNMLVTTGGKLLNTGSGGANSTGGRGITRVSTGVTWMTFLAQRVGADDGNPMNGLYPRGANLALFDLGNFDVATTEKLNIGPKNSSSFWNDVDAEEPTQLDYINFRYPMVNGAILEENLPNLTTNRPTPNTPGGAAGTGTFNGAARDAFANALVQDMNLYVIRIDHNGTELDADDVRVWINPRLDETPNNSEVSFAYIAADLQAAADTQMFPAGCTPGVDCSPYTSNLLDFGDQAFNYIRLFAGNVAGGGATPFAEILVDEIRVATTFADAAPFIAAPQGLPGDYNDDGVVDAADYTRWRDNLGAPDETALSGNGDGMNGVDAGDYTRWVDNFGSHNPGASSLGAGAVPEPGTFLLAVCAMVGMALARRRAA